MSIALSDDAFKAIENCGVWHQPDATTYDVTRIISSLGKILYITDVTVRLESKSLVSSAKALDYHTDHHRADLILWHCIEQSDEGGETIILDGYLALMMANLS